jgi:hypothetical protein
VVLHGFQQSAVVVPPQDQLMGIFSLLVVSKASILFVDIEKEKVPNLDKAAKNTLTGFIKLTD